MIIGDIYIWSKALHVVAVVTFIGGMLAATLALCAAEEDGAANVIGKAMRWDRTVTTPALLFVWIFGVAVAAKGHWFVTPWLQAKLGIVALLSGAHGLNSGRLRRLADGMPARPALPPIAVVGLAAAVVVLAVVKPG